MVELGHALDMTVIAEGAETAEEVAILTQMGTDHIQGYYFSRPLPASEVHQRVAAIGNRHPKNSERGAKSKGRA